MQSAPVFIGHIVDVVVGNGQSGTDLTTVGRIVWKMCFVSGRAETARYNTVPGNITEQTAVYMSPSVAHS